jgi:hypothetical protein
MGVKAGPRIVKEGLVLDIDAANSRCYSGSGLTYNELISGTGGTLVNGVGFTSSNNGSFIFDGTNDTTQFTITNFSNIISVEIWMKMKSFAISMPFGFNRYDVYVFSGAIGYNTASANDMYGLTSTQVTNLGLLNQWKHYIFEMRSDVSYTNNKIYVNGEIQTLSQISGTESAANRNFNSGNGRISGWLNDTGYNQSMDLSQFKIYNRALTAQEILQNYNATKKRYGL